MVQAARTRLWIANAYFVPSKAILEMIKRKASEGVEERLAIRHRWHDERAARAERAAERLDEPEGPAGDGTHGPERRVNEKDGSLAHAERTELVFDLRGGAFAGHGGKVGRHHA